MPVVVVRVKLLSCLTLVAFIAPDAGLGFGAKAHRLAGHIAESQLCDSAVTAWAEIFPDLSVAEAGLWADQIRADRAWDRARPWHYMNISDATTIAEATRSKRGDVLGAIRFFAFQAGNASASDAQRELALLMLVHFVVDVHQPLHVGRKSDLGGNLVNVLTGTYEGNLHAYWDTEVFAGLESSKEQALALLLAHRNGHPSLPDTDPAAWATESQQLRAAVYAFGFDHEGRGHLNSAYVAMARTIARERLVLAGLRLAGVLNRLWCLDVPP